MPLFNLSHSLAGAFLLCGIEGIFLWRWTPFYYHHGLMIRHFAILMDQPSAPLETVQAAVEGSCSGWLGEYRCHTDPDSGDDSALFFRGGWRGFGCYGLSPAIRGRISVTSDQIDVFAYINFWPILLGSVGLANGMVFASHLGIAPVLGIIVFLVYIPGAIGLEFWRLRSLKMSLLKLGSSP